MDFLTAAIILLPMVVADDDKPIWCSNDVTLSPLQFKYPRDENNTSTLLNVEGYRIELECCVQSTAPYVNWTYNGNPLSYYGDSFTLLEKGQVLRSAEKSLTNAQLAAGLFTCTAWNGTDSISTKFNIFIPPRGRRCSDESTAEVQKGYPPTDVYNVVPYSSVQLKCQFILYCVGQGAVINIWWMKYYEPVSDDSFNQFYTLYQSENSQNDNATGDFVTVTSQKIGDNVIPVNSTLTIRNVTHDDLHDLGKPYGYLYPDCAAGSNDSCNATKSRNYYECVYASPTSSNPLQRRLPQFRIVTLHAAQPPTPPPTNVSEPKPDAQSLQREGIIIGCVIGGSLVVIMLLALLFSVYEWHIKLYVKRLVLQAQHRLGVKRESYFYDCYVACCSKDEQFVYDLLRQELEESYGYKLCLPERDFPIGTAIPDQIAHCVKNSEYFVAVISPLFWKTDWCNLAVDIALRTNVKIVAMMVQSDEGKDKISGNESLTKALKSPGCTRINFKTTEYGKQDYDKLVLKLRCAMPRLDVPRSDLGRVKI